MAPEERVKRRDHQQKRLELCSRKDGESGQEGEDDHIDDEGEE